MPAHSFPAARDGYPTTRDDLLPSNMPAFKMPIKAGEHGNQPFRYNPARKTLYTDLELERTGSAVQFIDNVTITSKTQIPELKRLWDLTKGWRANLDAAHREAEGLAPEDAEEPSMSEDTIVEPDEVPDNHTDSLNRTTTPSPKRALTTRKKNLSNRCRTSSAIM